MLIFYGALKPKWDMSCEGVKSEIECVPHMQNKKWNSLVKMSCLSLTQFLRYLWRNLSSQSRSQDFARISTFRFSAPKNWKTSGSQPDVLLQEIFHKKSSSLAGHVYFSFWLWKWRGRVKKDYPVTQCLSFGLISSWAQNKDLGCKLASAVQVFPCKNQLPCIKSSLMQWNNMKLSKTMAKNGLCLYFELKMRWNWLMKMKLNLM